MKKIGFADFYISEWHANNYPAWIAAASKEMGEDFAVAYVWAEQETSPVDGITTAEWCAKFGAVQCESLEELCERSDYIVILAPSSPEKHLAYAEKVLSYGKNTYIDKTFAADVAMADKIFAAAKANGTRFFSTSALRYATELAGLAPASFVCTTGGGRSLEEYIVHQAEMIVKLIREDVLTVEAAREGDVQRFFATFAGGKRAELAYAPSLGFSVGVDGAAPVAVRSDFFKLLIADMLRFFLTGEASFEGCETMQVMRLRDAVLRAAEKT